MSMIHVKNQAKDFQDLIKKTKIIFSNLDVLCKWREENYK